MAANVEEKRLIEEFRDRVSEILKTDEQKKDTYLIRWLRARDLDLGKAEKMLMESLLWRQQNGVDNNFLEKELDPFFKREFPYYIESVDKHGQPVLFVPVGKWDFRKIMNAEKIEEFKTFTAYLFESVCRKMSEQGTRNQFPVTQFTLIVDWNGYSYMQLANIKAVQNMLSIGMAFEAHYPEILFRAYYINCPSFFSIVLALIKTVIAQRTLAKLTVHGWNRDEWEQAILENIDHDQLSIILQRMNE